MFARQVIRSAAPIRQGARQYSAKATREPLQAAAPWKQAFIIGGVGLAGYYAYSSLGGNPKEAAAKLNPVAPSKVFTGGNEMNVNHNTKRLRFSFEDKDAVSGLNVASALLTKYQAPGMEKPVVRPYTPVSDEGDTGYLDLLVKKYPKGPMSTHLHDLEPGQRLQFKGPLPKYAWTQNKHEHIALIAGGTGITPMYQLTRAIFNNPSDTTKVTLVFGNVSEADILLKKEFEQLENEFPNRFKAFYVLDNPPKELKANYGKGFITKDLLKTVLPPADKGAAVKVFVCGPPPLYKAISGGKKSPQDQGELSGYLQELGYSKDQVYKF